jgi:maltose alpha-D-glucosyltransferase/alpha-amylase
MVTEEERQWMWEEYAPHPRMRLNLGIRRRLAPLLDNDQRKILLANALLYSLPGAPIIYYGDEIGMGDNIWLPDRNGVRTPMQWDDSKNAGFSDAPEDELYEPLIKESDYDFRKVNVATEKDDPKSLLSKMKHLVSVRKSLPILAVGDYEFLAKDHKETLVILREFENEHLICVLNLSDKKQTISLNLSTKNGYTVRDVYKDQRFPPIQKDPYPIEVKPYGFHWLRLIEK